MHIDLNDYQGAFGFVSKAGYVIGLGLHMKSTKEIPESIGNLKYLKKLDLSICRNLQKLPDNFSLLENLEKLKYDYNTH